MMQQPMGLQALMQRQRPAASQPGMGIPPGLQALLQAQQVLRSQASPVTMDGRPTIARQTEQAIAQQTAPQAGAMAPNPQMQPQNPGTVAQAAQSAGIAGQQQQAQQQQAMQAAMQMAQQQQGQQPQGMARGGVAALKADNLTSMKYAQGGVAGYNGEDESYVQAEKDREAMLSGLKKMAAAGYDVLTLIPRGLMGAAESGVTRPLRALGLPIPYLPESAYGGDRRSLTPAMDALLRAEAVQPAKRGSDLTPQQIEQSVKGAVAPAAAASPRPTGPRPTAMPAAAAPAPVPAQPTLAEPSFESIMQTAQKLAPADPVVQQMLDRQKKKEALEAARPAFEEQGIAALQAADADRKRLLEQQRGGDTLRRVTGFANLLYKKDLNALERVDDLIALREKESSAAGLATEQMQLKMREAAYQRKLGNEDEAMKLFGEVAKLNEARLGHQATLANANANLQAAIYGDKMRLQGSRETNAMHLKIEQIKIASQLGRLDQQKQGMAIAAAKAVEADPLLKNLATMAQGGDPAAIKRYKDREAEIYLTIAPELMLGGGAPSASGTRAKADAIVGGKQ